MLVLLTVSYGTTELAGQVLILWVKVNGNGTRFYSPESGDLSVGCAQNIDTMFP